MSKKPTVKLVGQNGNIYNLVSFCAIELVKAGQLVQAEEMAQRVFYAKSYDEALCIILEYVDAE